MGIWTLDGDDDNDDDQVLVLASKSFEGAMFVGTTANNEVVDNFKTLINFTVEVREKTGRHIKLIN